MSVIKKLSNLQIELLQVFNYELSDDQILEIRKLLANYFSEKVTKGVDSLFEINHWGNEKIEEWSKEHMRTKYN